MIETTEAPFSANFKLWHPAGVQVQLTVRNPDPQSLDLYIINTMAAIEKALQQGFTVTEPVPVEGERIERIAGYVVGEYSDKGGQFRPCVWLYPDDKRTFKVATVYPEHFDQLPFTVTESEWPGQAPDIDTARKKGCFHDCKFEIVMQPKVDFNGEPRHTDDGKIIYRFAGVRGAKPAQQQTTDGGKPVDVAKAVAWALEEGKFASPQEAEAALKAQWEKFPGLSNEQMRQHWIEYVRGLPELPPPDEENPFNKPASKPVAPAKQRKAA